MTLDEIAYNILNLLRGGRSSNDEFISIDQIKFNIKQCTERNVSGWCQKYSLTKNGVKTRQIELDCARGV